jgi:hypothetical protein
VTPFGDETGPHVSPNMRVSTVLGIEPGGAVGSKGSGGQGEGTWIRLDLVWNMCIVRNHFGSMCVLCCGWCRAWGC